VVSRLVGLDRKLQVGRYDIQKGHSRWDVISILKHGESIPVRFTIPEGMTMKKIIPILAKATEKDESSFEVLAGDPAFLEPLGVEAPTLEGYLFPETYTVPWFSTEEYVLESVIEQLDNFLNDSLEQRIRELGFTRLETLTLASLVESEARHAEERPLISSVYHNRLRKGMLLQCDPTVIYALGGLNRPLLYKDLEFDSPYNTYKYRGLPPGPICSPGAASILAALYPADSDFIYFVADGEGRHVFTRTLKDHNAAKNRIKAEKRAEGG
jgi:UPF0755 protein